MKRSWHKRFDTDPIRFTVINKLLYLDSSANKPANDLLFLFSPVLPSGSVPAGNVPAPLAEI